MPSTQGNWVVEGTDNKKYYINVCRSLNKVPVDQGCGPFAAVCRTKLENSQVRKLLMSLLLRRYCSKARIFLNWSRC